jgi:hypothetical protein
MTLKEKFNDKIVSFLGDSMKEQNANQCEQIADDYAIEFAEWLLWQDITSRGKNNFICADGIKRNTKELLQIFKKIKHQNNTTTKHLIKMNEETM